MKHRTGHGCDVQAVPRAVDLLGDERAVVLVADVHPLKAVLAERACLYDQLLGCRCMRVDDGDGDGVLVKLRDKGSDAIGQSGAAA